MGYYGDVGTPAAYTTAADTTIEEAFGEGGAIIDNGDPSSETDYEGLFGKIAEHTVIGWGRDGFYGTTDIGGVHVVYDKRHRNPVRTPVGGSTGGGSIFAPSNMVSVVILLGGILLLVYLLKRR